MSVVCNNFIYRQSMIVRSACLQQRPRLDGVLVRNLTNCFKHVGPYNVDAVGF